MKLINLLIKMSKGNYPNVFNYDGYYWRLEDGAYFNECDEQLEDYCTITRCLNENVEILGGNKDEQRRNINKIFEWLEENVNKHDFYYFKMQNANQITAYWKMDNKPFAQFYIKSILKVIEESD